MRQGRTGELGAHRCQQLIVTRYGTQFRARNRFHRVDQHRQPQTLAARRSPSLDLLTHRLSFWLLQTATRKSPARSRFRNQFTLQRRNHTRCDLLHRSSPAARRIFSRMSQESYPAPFESDIRIDYALIVVGVAAAVFAFIYLMLV